MDRDPTRVTDQPALTESSGLSWLVIGGLIALIGVVLLFSLRELRPAGTAVVGIAVVVPLYLAMVAVRFGARAGRTRLALLATLTLALCAALLVCVLVMAFTEAGAVAG